jgi:hypothetical protein
MTAEAVRFLLAGGETLVVPAKDLRRVYEILWGLAPEAGAIAVAALVHQVLEMRDPSPALVDLTAPQSAALEKALALLQSSP